MLSYAVSRKYSEKARYAIDCNQVSVPLRISTPTHTQSTHPSTHLPKPTQELFAIGLAHTLGSLFGAFPVAGSFSRTAVAVESNQRSQVAGLVTSIMVLLAVNFLTSTFYWIPQCASDRGSWERPCDASRTLDERTRHTPSLMTE